MIQGDTCARRTTGLTENKGHPKWLSSVSTFYQASCLSTHECQMSNMQYHINKRFLVVLLVSFTDSPVSLSYRQEESTIFSPLYRPVHIPIEVTAYPRTVSFQWYFNDSGEGWVSVNSSDDRFNIIEQEMNSTLTINKLYLNLTGDYRVETSNGIRSLKVYGFTVRPEGTEF